MKRPIRIEGDTAYVTLTHGYVAAIDAADVPMIEAWDWFAVVARRADGEIRTVYAVRGTRTDAGWRSVYMHRVIAGTPDGMETDHIDCDGLNNRKSNLRDASGAQNQHNRRTSSNNTSGHKGVDWYKALGKWRARIRVPGGRRDLGYFDTKSAAVAAYAKASAELHGEFGRIA